MGRERHYHGFRITARQGKIVLPNRQIDLYWIAEGRNEQGIYLNSHGRAYPSEREAVMAVYNAIDYYRRKKELI